MNPQARLDRVIEAVRQDLPGGIDGADLDAFVARNRGSLLALLGPPRLRVVRTCRAMIVHGQIEDHCGGVDGQVTEIDTDHGRAWVRESIRRIGQGHAGQRLRVHRGEALPPGEWVLDLAVARPRRWAFIAAIVHAADQLSRTVRRSPRWTPAFALAILARERS